jgi:DNA-binding PadR family transcriptional regulator
MNKSYRRSPLALAVLALLYEEPLHPYRMQRLIKERGKDQVINVRQRASLYQTIDRLERDGLIRVQETTRQEKWPERTVYELTPAGRATAYRWLGEMLTTPAPEFPEFPAALAHLALLTPAATVTHLESRARALAQNLARLEDDLRSAPPELPRLFLIESEYLRAMWTTELEWVRALLADLRAGRLTWDEEWTRQVAESLGSTGHQGEEEA